MKAIKKANVKDFSQQKVWSPKSELNVIEAKIKDDQVMSEDDVKFVGELGWLTAASVLVASLAVGL